MNRPLMSDSVYAERCIPECSTACVVLLGFWHLCSKLHRKSLAGFAWHSNNSSFGLIEICWDTEQEV